MHAANELSLYDAKQRVRRSTTVQMTQSWIDGLTREENTTNGEILEQTRLSRNGTSGFVRRNTIVPLIIQGF